MAIILDSDQVTSEFIQNNMVLYLVKTSEKLQRNIYKWSYKDEDPSNGRWAATAILEVTAMSDTRRGLPLTKSQREKIFPKLTPAQISRIAADGQIHSVQPGKVLIEQGDTSVPFFVFF